MKIKTIWFSFVFQFQVLVHFRPSAQSRVPFLARILLSHIKISKPFFKELNNEFKTNVNIGASIWAEGWKCEDLKLKHITGKKNQGSSSRRGASRSWEILFRLTSSTLSHHAMFRPWWPRLESARDLLALCAGVNWKKSSSLWIHLGWWSIWKNKKYKKWFVLCSTYLLLIFVLSSMTYVRVPVESECQKDSHPIRAGSQGGSWGQS